MAMTNQALIERYIYAVTRRLPQNSREDVSRELEGLIADMAAERCGEAEPTREQLREVLLELGNPHALAAQYHPNQQGLIPQPYFSQYLTVLPIVLAAICGSVAAALMVVSLMDGSILPQLAGGTVDSLAAVGRLLGGIVSTIADVVVWTFFWVTIGFAVAARNGAKTFSKQDFLDDLPEVPSNRKPLGRSEPICTIVLSVLATVVLLGVPQVICVISHDYAPGPVPVFDLARMQQLWPALLLMGLSGVVRGCAKLMEGWHTRRLLVVTLVCNTVAVVCSLVWLASPAILSADYRAVMGSILEDNGSAQLLMQNLNLVVLGSILLGYSIDTADELYTTLRR